MMLSFKQWVNEKFVVDEIDWRSIMIEDEHRVYEINPLVETEDSSTVPLVGRSVDIADENPGSNLSDQDSDDACNDSLTYSFN